MLKREIKAVIPETADQAANRKKKGARGGRPVSRMAAPAALESARSAKTELLAFGFDQLLHEFLRVHRVLGVMEDVIVLGA